MIFSSVPPYLDPLNWQQQPSHQVRNENLHQIPPLQPPPPPLRVGGSMGSIRPGSMTDRARLAKLPQPEAAVKCPRCESTNTKFCYYNNYSLTQPRHFCKTCRRYWTQGGALRNVPVGGGCRRNKKSKSKLSKSPSTTEKQVIANSSSSNSSRDHQLIGHLPNQTPQLPFMPSLQNFNRFGSNFNEIQTQTDQMGFQLGNHSSILCGGGSVDVDHDHQWRSPHQFGFLGGFESSSNLYPFDHNEGADHPPHCSIAEDMASISRVNNNNNHHNSQFPPIKMEGNNQVLNLLKPSLDVSNNNQIWGSNATAWSDISSSTNHLF